ncbi:unnamed protein product [Meloidogyne enterolobii]|uniref:Uncharacterized protein n=1 Tax=Meloidogyne enterolobii TaxID=390850 RepID=A0ACB0YUN0_MELEN
MQLLVVKREKLEAAVKVEAAVKLEAVASMPVEDVALVMMMATEEMVGMVNDAVLSEAVAIEGEEEMEVIIEREDMT